MLTNFYRDLQGWIDAGCPEPNELRFRKDLGLCGNLDKWCESQSDLPYEEWTALDIELGVSFEQANLSYMYPFNEGRIEFRQECGDRTLYQNPKRLQWVKDHAN